MRIFRTLKLTLKTMSSNVKQNYPSADRNKHPILEILKKHFNSTNNLKVLEIASGTGQQASFYGENFPNLQFQTSEVDESLFESIKAYADDTLTKNVRHPIKLDASHEDWKINEKFDYAICVNMFHVSPLKCTLNFFKNLTKCLNPGGLIVTYGAYAFNGKIEPQSNVDFDKLIRKRNPEFGLRDIKDLEKLANDSGILLEKKYDLPSNNKCLVWKKLG